MKTKVFAFFYREEFLVPFFLSHYRWADKIYAIVSQSPDRTRELLAAAPNVEIEDFEFTAGMDDAEKTTKINQLLALHDADYDWHIVVDSDEFIWPAVNLFLEPRVYLESVENDISVVIARMQNVFRHETDLDLDPRIEPVVLQRRHGIPGYGGENALYQKPIVFRSNCGVQLALGNHAINNVQKVAQNYYFQGAHWGNADPAFCVARRVRDRRDRQSKANLAAGLGSQHHHTSVSDVINYCSSHLKDPKLF